MADGTLTIDTRTDEKGVKVGMKDIEASVKRMSVSVEKLGDKAKIALQRQLDSLSKLNNQYGQQEQKVEALKKRLKELSDQKIETEEYKRLGKEIDGLYEKSAKLEAELNQWRKLGVPENSNTFRVMDEELQKVISDISKLEEKQAEMKSSGTSYADPRSLSEYQSTASRLTVEEMRLDDMNNRLNTSFAATEMRLKECGEEAARSSSKFSGLAESAQRFAEKLKQSGINGMKRKLHELWQALDKLMSKFMQLASGAIVGGLQKISGGIFAIHKSANKSTLSLKNLLKYAFGIRSLFALFNKLRGAVTEGIQNLALHDLLTNTGNVNQSLSELQSALTLLKNSFATAFAPLLTVASPILVQFINLVSQAVTRVGMLIAALTGQKTFTRATQVQQNYAASLDKTADSAKKATQAVEGYLSPIDEVNRYDDGSSSSRGSGSGGYTGPSASDMFEEVPIESSIKGIADKVKKLIKNEDWESLGTYMAEGINKGLQKVYDAISWKNVGPKVTSFVTAFTETFNSLVDHIDWYLMGKTVGTGINTVVKALNLALTKIDWEKLGKKFAKGIKGLVNEVNWKELGELLGNKFMVPWKIFSGFVRDLPYADIGKAFANTLDGVFSRISFSEIGNSLATALNGAFTSLYNFAIHFNWTRLVNNIAGGINTFVGKFDWKGNGQKLETFLDKLCTSIVDYARKTDWEKVGRGIGEFLGQVKWGEHFVQVGSAILKALKGMFDGMETSGTAGKIASFLGKAFLTVKIADVIGIGNLVRILVGTIGKKVIGSDMVASLSGKLTSLLGDAVSGAAGSFTDLATAISPLVGTAGLIVAVGAAAAGATSELAKFVETMQGGNGIGTTFGNTMNNFIQLLQGRGDLISSSAEEVWQLKESLEQEGMTAEDKATATQKLIDKLSSMGVTSTQARLAFSSLHQQGLITDDMFNILAESIKTMSNKTSNMAGSVDLGNKKIKEGSKEYQDMKVAIGNVTNQLHLGIDAQGSLNQALDNVVDSGGTAQDAYKAIMSTAGALGLNTESVAKIFAEKFPAAVKATETSARNAMSGTKTSVTTAMGTVSTAVANASSLVSKNTTTGFGLANTAVGTAMSGMKKATENAMPSIWSGVKNANEKVSSSSKTNWGNSASEVDKNLDKMKQHTNLKLGEMQKTVYSHFSSQYNTMTDKWKFAKDRILQIVDGLGNELATHSSNLQPGLESSGYNMGQSFVNGFSNAMYNVNSILNDVVSKVNSTIGNVNGALRSIENSFTFKYTFTNPTTHRAQVFRSSMELPRVDKVPYLATGAVIPPRSEFLAVLGDQKNGRNLELPEGLLRQIFREEVPQNNGGNSYNVSVKASGRTLLDIVLEEGELRRNRNGGRNPFELA